MSSMTILYNVLLFMPCFVVVTMTITNLLRSCRHVNYATHRQWKLMTVCCYIIHSVSVALYLGILPMDYMNHSLDLSLFSIHSFDPFLLCYNLWCIIIVSMCLLQMVRAYMILQLSRHRTRYNYSIFCILMAMFMALWTMLYVWRTQVVIAFIFIFKFRDSHPQKNILSEIE